MKEAALRFVRNDSHPHKRLDGEIGWVGRDKETGRWFFYSPDDSEIAGDERKEIALFIASLSGS